MDITTNKTRDCSSWIYSQEPKPPPVVAFHAPLSGVVSVDKFKDNSVVVTLNQKDAGKQITNYDNHQKLHFRNIIKSNNIE